MLIKKNCHHLFKVNSIFYDAPIHVYHFDVKCEYCGLIRRALDFTESSLKWNMQHVDSWKDIIEVHEIHTFATPEEVQDVRFGD